MNCFILKCTHHFWQFPRICQYRRSLCIHTYLIFQDAWVLRYSEQVYARHAQDRSTVGGVLSIHHRRASCHRDALRWDEEEEWLQARVREHQAKTHPLLDLNLISTANYSLRYLIWDTDVRLLVHTLCIIFTQFTLLLQINSKVWADGVLGLKQQFESSKHTKNSKKTATFSELPTKLKNTLDRSRNGTILCICRNFRQK